MFQSIAPPIIFQKYPYRSKHIAWLLFETTYTGKALAAELIHYVQAHRCEKQPILFCNMYG